MISMHDKREKSPPSIFMSLHYAKDKPYTCMATTLEAGFLPGRDKHVLNLIHSPSLVATQTLKRPKLAALPLFELTVLPNQ